MSKILVCDDDKEIVEAIDIYLTQEGYQVLKAYDGEEALKMLKAQKVDLLVIDVMMPRLDGIRATLKIREEIICLLLFCLPNQRMQIRSLGSMSERMIM